MPTRKATNLEQDCRSGNGVTSRIIGKTLKAAKVVCIPCLGAEEGFWSNAMSGWPRGLGSRWFGEIPGGGKIRRGERLKGRLNTEPEERFGPRSKTLKVRGLEVAAGGFGRW
jgi:hypothetical protein